VLLVAVPLAFLLLTFGLTILLQRDTEQTAGRARHATAVLAESDAIFRTLSQGGRSIGAYSKSHAPSSLAGYHAALAALPAHFKMLDQLVAGDPEMVARAKNLETGVNGIIAIWSRYIGYAAAGATQKIHAMTTSASTQHTVTIWQRSKLLLDASERSRLGAAFGVLRARLRLLEGLLIGLTALGIVLTLLVATLFGLRLVSRLRKLADNSRRLAVGQPAAPLRGNDEFADLDRVYRELTTRLIESLQQKDQAVAAYEREHAVATMLQRALLPQDLPSVPGLRIDSTYVPASQLAEIGGDWYDVFELPDRRIGLSVGDVAGHGLRAATTMGSVRQAIRHAARFEAAPSAVLRHVNQTLCSDEVGVVTAFFGVLDLKDGTLRYSLAGHPAPIVVEPTGGIEFLKGQGIVLGFDARTPFEDFEVKLDVGSGLVLFTDGIVEIERDYLKGIRDLVEAVSAEYFNPSPNIAEGIQRRAARGLKGRDDAAVLFIGITSLGADSSANTERRWSFDASDEAAARRMKRAVLWQFAGLASTAPEFGAVEAILGELLSNVVRHSPGEATILMEPREDEIVLHVDDHGNPFDLNGKSPPNVFAENGRGLLIVGAFARELSVTRKNGGNRVSVVLPLPETFSVRP
jgi:serine phosphatase RsbU (regulator of sigma subunit)/anti-sigma regulatory factor (Ser/Thr protein kinase)/CHASE3 domain sensor protein